jgi:ferritin-like metal-binding protein YciE
MQEFQNLFQAELASLDDADRRIAKALPKMARASAHTGRKKAETHPKRGERHVAGFLLEDLYEEAIAFA